MGCGKRNETRGVLIAVRGDLVKILHKLLKRRNKFDYIIIETTGLADPAPVAQTFFVDDILQEQLSLDAIVTVVDAKHVQQHLDETKPEGVENEVIRSIHLLIHPFCQWKRKRIATSTTPIVTCMLSSSSSSSESAALYLSFAKPVILANCCAVSGATRVCRCGDHQQD